MNKDLSLEDQELVSLAVRTEFNNMKNFGKSAGFSTDRLTDEAGNVLEGLKEHFYTSESLEKLRRIGKQQLLDQYRSSDQTHREGPG